MEATLRVRRFNTGAKDGSPYFQDYRLEVEPTYTVLDALIKVQEEMDETLALRYSCRSAICGSCAMHINGHAALACKTKLSNVMRDGQAVVIEPMSNMPVVKDMVVDMESFWAKVVAVDPWLTPPSPEPQGEHLVPNETMLHLAGVMNCIMCGACVSDCTVLEVDSNFLAPAALAKAYRLVADPRDSAAKERLGKLSQYGGIWDCTRCMECTQVCPKDVDPMGRIMALREKAMQAGYTGNYGARHSMAFAELVRHSGRLDELRLPIKTFGMFNIRAMFGLLPIGVRAMLRRKLPPIRHRRIPGAEGVRRIFEKVESKK